MPAKASEHLAIRLAELPGKKNATEITREIERFLEEARAEGVGEDWTAEALRLWTDQIDAKRLEFPRQRSALAALRVHLMHRPERSILSTLRRIAAWAADHWAVASAVLAITAAAAVRIAYVRFYGVFGLTPEDAGVDTVELLSGSAPGVVVIVLLSAGLLAVAYVPASAVNEASLQRLVKGRGEQSKVAAVWLFGMAVLVCVAFAYLLFFTDVIFIIPVDPDANPILAGATMGAVAGGLGFVLGVTFVAAIRAIRTGRKHLRPYIVPPRWRTIGETVIGVVPTVLVLVLLVLPSAAGARAQDLLSGRSVTSITVFGVPVLSISAPMVHVERSIPALPEEGCFFLLGTSDTFTFLYQAGKDKMGKYIDTVHRLPNGDVMLTYTFSTTTCE